VTGNKETNVPNILMIGQEAGKAGELDSELTRRGYTCLIADNIRDAAEALVGKVIDLVIVDVDAPSSAWTESVWELLRGVRPQKPLPVIAIIPREMVDEVNSISGIDDFIVNPPDPSELNARVQRNIRRTKNNDNKEIIRCGDLVIDTAKYEVYLSDRILSLTFTEYELLKFLASNRGRVFSRDTLLNEVWGYDYYGGDRTVDVHIRRLRSKIEDPIHTYIDTVRNIGYRFK